MTKVVLIHWGDNEYVRLAQKQAMKYNDVDLLLDVPVSKGVSLEIERWFILHEYMSFRKLDRVLHIDSDVLLFKDVDKDFTDCDMAFSKSHSGHNMFINNIEALDSFCLYAQKNRDNLSLINKTRGRLPGHVFADTMGDMVLLNNFMFDSKYFFRDTYKLRGLDFYSHNVNTEPQIFWGQDLLPYWDSGHDVIIKMNSLHFQGGAKERMKEWAKIYLGL